MMNKKLQVFLFPIITSLVGLLLNDGTCCGRCSCCILVILGESKLKGINLYLFFEILLALPLLLIRPLTAPCWGILPFLDELTILAGNVTRCLGHKLLFKTGLPFIWQIKANITEIISTSASSGVVDNNVTLISPYPTATRVKVKLKLLAVPPWGMMLKNPKVNVLNFK